MRSPPATRTPWPSNFRGALKSFSPSTRNCVRNARDRVVELLLTEDCVTPARAAKFLAALRSRRRRLFDRLVELERPARTLGATELPALRAVGRTAMGRTKAANRGFRRRARRPAARRALARMDVARRGGDLRRSRTPCRAKTLPGSSGQAAISTISSPISR